MIKKLQALKARKGFTMIELIVVIAIIAVLAAVILPMVSARDSKIKEANSTARDFYAALQMVMTKYSLYDGVLSPAYQANADLGEMRYFEKMGGNYPYKAGTTAGDFPTTASLYVEITAKNNQITQICTYTEDSSASGYADGAGLYQLCQRTSDRVNTEFGNLLKSEIEDSIQYRDGCYYAKVTYKNILTGTVPQKMEAETLKVEYTGYTRKPLPSPGSMAFSAYQTANLYFGEDNVLVNDEVFGVCASLNTDTGTVLGIAGTALT